MDSQWLPLASQGRSDLKAHRKTGLVLRLPSKHSFTCFERQGNHSWAGITFPRGPPGRRHTTHDRLHVPSDHTVTRRGGGAFREERGTTGWLRTPEDSKVDASEKLPTASHPISRISQKCKEASPRTKASSLSRDEDKHKSGIRKITILANHSKW